MYIVYFIIRHNVILFYFCTMKIKQENTKKDSGDPHTLLTAINIKCKNECKGERERAAHMCTLVRVCVRCIYVHVLHMCLTNTRACTYKRFIER